MQLAALAFLVGVLALQRCVELPDRLWCLGLPVGLLVLWRKSSLRVPAALAAGFLWALWRAHGVLDTSLPAALEGKDIEVTGTVVGLAERLDARLRFEFDPEGLSFGSARYPSCGRVQLDWAGAGVAPRAGERWRLAVRLKRPHGMRNPGGFDHEAWLFQRHVRALGYVRASVRNERLSPADRSVAGVREGLRARLDEAIGFHPLGGVVQALAIGARGGVTPEQRRVFQRTGTGHLLAISGLHVGLVAAFGFFLGRWLWSVPVRTLLYVPAPRAAACSGLAAAAGYAALAGFEVPAQRSVIMIAALLAGLWLDRPLTAADRLAAALLGVLVLDPLAVIAPGFWLSFVAVCILLYCVSGAQGRAELWRRLAWTHLAIAVGLLPLVMILFEQNPLLGPLANFVAVPWVSFVVVPLVLGGTFLTGLWDFLGYWFLRGALLALDLLWVLLEGLADLDFAVWYQPPPGVLAMACAFVGVAVLLMPRGLPARWLGLVWLAPALLGRPPAPAPGELWFTLLDVGQGLAAVARTAHHVLVFDTGGASGSRFDAGAAVVVPFLRHEGVERVDVLVVSHGDNDHIGGARSLLRELPVERVLSSVPERLPRADASACRDGETWTWDGVRFALLHPPPQQASSENDASCVLRIAVAEAGVLLPGDIEAGAERRLLEVHARDLAALVLVAPHHGSRTSSSAPFIAAVAPRYVLYPAGHRNRYHHPHPRVRERYRAAGAEELISGEEGAITFRLGQRLRGPERYRPQHRRYWHAP